MERVLSGLLASVSHRQVSHHARCLWSDRYIRLSGRHDSRHLPDLSHAACAPVSQRRYPCTHPVQPRCISSAVATSPGNEISTACTEPGSDARLPSLEQAFNATSSADGLIPPTFVKASGRIVAIGDIHGDQAKTISALEVAGVLAVDGERRPVWCGGDTVVVQLGDVLDRGDHEIGIFLLLRELDRQARLQGGAVYMLNGNHESLNVAGNFRYATAGAIRESALAAGLAEEDLGRRGAALYARLRLFAPGGAMARELAKNPTALMVNDTLFAHGGVMPHHVHYGLKRLNAEVAAWMRGDLLPDGSRVMPPWHAMGDATSVMWNRDVGRERFPNMWERQRACQQLETTLQLLGARQLVIGHTPQEVGANCECNGRVWRMDVGMSSGVLNAVPQVLEIGKADENGQTPVRLLKPAYPAAACVRSSLSAPLPKL